MASSSCLLTSQFNVSLKIDRSSLFPGTDVKSHLSQRCVSALGSMDADRPSREMVGEKMSPLNDWRFLGGSKLIISRSTFGRYTKPCRSSTAVHASWLNSPQIASSAFTLGTAAVLPFYTLMVVAPRADLTKKLVGSSIPYIALGILYAYLLFLSWTPDTIRLMFASKYLLPELPGIAKMFSSEMTLASAWIHLLAVDLFAARQVYYEGLKDNIETRHSVSLCLLFCPIGILAHCITKGVVRSRGATEH